MTTKTAPTLASVLRRVLPWLSCGLLASACFLKQELDTAAASKSASTRGTMATTTTGSGSTTSDSTGSSGPTGSSGAAGSSGSTGSSGSGQTTGTGGEDCDLVRSQARAVLQTNCAFCHENPNNVQGMFDFILEPAKLTTRVSTTGQLFVTRGDPESSRIYQRVFAGEMPPASEKVRPNMSDVAVMRQWIASCVDGTVWDLPAGGLFPNDAGVDSGPAGCGDPGQACCTANVCKSGCCVFGQCRAEGQTCGATGGGLGLPGTCSKGSCETADGMACGKVDEPCCEASSCTASRVSCLAGMTTCSACGGASEFCCKIGSANVCIDGFTCVGGGVNRNGTCQVCGGMDQPCCGTGVASQKTCTATLTCKSVIGVGDRCSP